MSTVEILALIFAVAVLLKAILLWVVVPKKIIDFASNIYKHKTLNNVIALVLILVSGFYLLKEISIIQLSAGIMFGFLLMGFALLQYPKEITNLAKSMLNNKKELFLPFAVFLIIAIGILITLFA